MFADRTDEQLLRELNDAIYREMRPYLMSVFPGCNGNPEDLVKHIVSSYVNTLCMLLERDPNANISHTNAVEEIVYDCMGTPSCYSTDSTRYFLNKKMSEISD